MEYTVTAIGVLVLRIVMFMIGFGFAYLGYKLFCKGIFEQSGDVEVAWKDTKVLLKKAAPGTVFAVFGAVFIIVLGFHPPTFERTKTESSSDSGKIGRQLPEVNPVAEAIDRAETFAILTSIKKLKEGQEVQGKECDKLDGWIRKQEEKFKIIGEVPPGPEIIG